jgi:NAD(P)-dependent dehydrogenase (short-subunit alcohol dehydrogenase family)
MMTQQTSHASDGQSSLASHSGDLHGKVCVVTGAAGVLCSALVEAMLEQGAKVALLGRTESKLVKLRDELKAKGYEDTLVCHADVLNRESLEASKELINKTFGPVYALVNGAGGNDAKGTTTAETMTPDTPLEDSFFGMKQEGFANVFDLNFNGTLLPCQVFGTDMSREKDGVIVNVSSLSALCPLTKVGAYSCAKSAVSSFTQWLSVHLSPMNVRVNALAPGFFITDQNRFLLMGEDGQSPTARAEKILRNTPMDRFGAPDDLKTAIQFLLHPASRFVTGITVPVDGGFSAYSGV